MDSPRRAGARGAAVLLAGAAALAVPAEIMAQRAAPVPPEGAARWEVSSPAAAGFDAEELAAAVAGLRALPGVRSVLVTRGPLVAAEVPPSGRAPARDVKSASKSILGALAGMAIADGALGLDDTVAQWLPQRMPAASASASAGGDARRAVTVRDLLEMRSGLASTSGAAYGSWVSSDDWVRAALARPGTAPPGERFEYSTGDTHVLAAVLDRAVGGLEDYARERLFAPLGVRPAGWMKDPQGVPFGGNGLSLRPRDLATFGRLVVDGGSAGGRQIVPRAWIEASIRPVTEGWPDRYGAYGRLWWIPPGAEPGEALAVGYGGQFLHVATSRGTVVVVTSDERAKGVAWDRRALPLLQRAARAAPAQGVTRPAARRPPP